MWILSCPNAVVAFLMDIFAFLKLLASRGGRFCLGVGVASWLVLLPGACADEAGVEFFEKKIRPVLVEHCYECHAEDAEKVQGGLLLDTREGIRLGGDSGAAVTPSEPAESLLLDALRYETFEMPPDGRLPAAVIADFEHWIRAGAADPRDEPMRRVEPGIDLEAGREFWAFQRPGAVAVPEVQDAGWSRSGVDRFILVKLEEQGLRPVGDADRVTLIRRAYYALVGLPPTVEEIEKFVNDGAALPEAFAGVVDRLLDSPQFGERWGRHWLDVVRYAESSGGGRSLMFPEAWRYRDYVIEAFNDDVPYDEFVKQQLAGDLLEAEDWQEQGRNITATAFLVLGPTNYELQDKNVLEMDIVDEQLDTIGKALLGMTLGCARCHDHKFDPIPTHDYYALAGILKSTQSVLHENVSTWNTTDLPLQPEEREAFAKFKAKMDKLLHEKEDQIVAFIKAGGTGEQLENPRSIAVKSLPGVVVDDTRAKRVGEWTSSQSEPGYVGKNYLHSREEGAAVTYLPKLPEAGEYEVRVTYTPHANRSPKVPVQIFYEGGAETVFLDQKQAGSLRKTIASVGTFVFDPQSNPRVVISTEGAAEGAVIADAVLFVHRDLVDEDAESRIRREGILAEIRAVDKKLKSVLENSPKRQAVMAVVDTAEVGDIPLAIRGVVHNAGPIVTRGVLQVAEDGEMPAIAEGQSGRLELAEWIASAENPLTARVVVNRVWSWLFGQGLVSTVDNFGSMGETPSHPELLDFLAKEFVADGWSIKRLIRRLMLSRVYQLQSVGDLDAEAVDPGNRLYWRMNRLRLDAESLRDTLLMLGGELDLTVGGPNIKEETESEYGYEFDGVRRSVYEPVFRNAVPAIFSTFDFADPNIQVGQRTRSTTAPQALLLMNHPLVMQQAAAAAERLLAAGEMSVDERVVEVYRQVVGRVPSGVEAELARKFIGNSEEAARWGLLYHTLFQSLDFRFLD